MAAMAGDEIARAKAAQIASLNTDAAEAEATVAMQRTRQQDEEIRRLKALVSRREAAFSELLEETERARESRLETEHGGQTQEQQLAQLKQLLWTLPEPEPEPEPEPGQVVAALLAEGGADEPGRIGSAASSAWAAAAILDVQVAKLSEEERALTAKDEGKREAREAEETAEEAGMEEAERARIEAAANLATVIEAARVAELEAQEEGEAALRAAMRAKLQEQAAEAGREQERKEAAETEAFAESARAAATMAAKLLKNEEEYKALRAAAELREAAVREIEEQEYEAAKLRAIEHEKARRKHLASIAGGSGAKARRHLAHVTTRENSARGQPSSPTTPKQIRDDEPPADHPRWPSTGTGGDRKVALANAEHRLNSLQVQLEAEKSSLQKELIELVSEEKIHNLLESVGLKTEGTPSAVSALFPRSTLSTGSAKESSVKIQQISKQLDEVSNLTVSLHTQIVLYMMTLLCLSIEKG